MYCVGRLRYSDCTLTGRGIFFPDFPPVVGFLELLLPPPFPDFPAGVGGGGPGVVGVVFPPDGCFFDLDVPVATVGREDDDGDL